MKVCSGCGEEKPLAHFNGSSKTADGKAPRCRACVNARRRELTRLGRAKVRPPLKARPAAKKGDIDALKAALKLAPETDLTLLLSTAVTWATESKAPRYAEVVRFLIDFGADPGGRGALGMPMPALAARSGVPQLVRLLRDAGAEVSFYTGAALADIDVARDELTRSPELARDPDTNGMTAMEYCANSALCRLDDATEQRLAELGEMLLDHGADSGVAAESYTLPLSIAAGHSGNRALVELLMRRAPHPPYVGPLSEALRTMQRQGDRYAEICDALLPHGPYDLDSMLLGQARHEDVQATIWLLANGADPSLRVEDGRTTLHLAADRNSGVRVVGLLLDSGADIDARDDLGNTPLHYARQREKHRIVELLLSRGATE